MARTKQTLRMENRRKALSRPPTDSSSLKDDAAKTESLPTNSDPTEKTSSATDKNPQASAQSTTKEGSNESSLSPALSQPDLEDPAEGNMGGDSKKRKMTDVDTGPAQPESLSQEKLSPDNKRQKATEQTEGDTMKPGLKLNQSKETPVTAADQSTLLNRIGAPETRQASAPTGVQCGTAPNPSLTIHQSANHSLGGNAPALPLSTEGFGFTAEDRRLLFAFREVNKDFWVRVSHAIRQIGGGTHSPERCKERFEILQRL